MDQNVYDNDIFFSEYQRIRQSPGSVNAIFEQPAFRALLPDVSNKKILDIGCGFGDNCLYYGNNGAKEVLGIDISEKMIDFARSNNHHPAVSYRAVTVENAELPKMSFDIVTSSLVFHYIENYRALISCIRDLLLPGGTLIFSVEHPVTTAMKDQSWVKDDKENLLFWPVDLYGVEGPRQVDWLIKGVIKYHRTLETYLMTLLSAGFTIEAAQEPMPTESQLQTWPTLASFRRRPAFLLVKANLAFK
jgi:2-polyprenyl-3-methyl-5-hydroxy-6-metoxy-1,4-benzoquinol methylase